MIPSAARPRHSPGIETFWGAPGFSVEVLYALPGNVRALVSRGEDCTLVVWAHDSAWRFMPPIRDPAGWYRLHDVDLAINKLLALTGRDEAPSAPPGPTPGRQSGSGDLAPGPGGSRNLRIGSARRRTGMPLLPRTHRDLPGPAGGWFPRKAGAFTLFRSPRRNPAPVTPDARPGLTARRQTAFNSGGYHTRPARGRRATKSPYRMAPTW